VSFLTVGKAYAIFKTKSAADTAISKINSGLVVGGRYVFILDVAYCVCIYCQHALVYNDCCIKCGFKLLSPLTFCTTFDHLSYSKKIIIYFVISLKKIEI
jgi:hypothetical protein